MHVEDEPTGLEVAAVVAGERRPGLVRGLVPGAAPGRGELPATEGAGVARLARVYPQVLLQQLLCGEHFATLAAAALLVSG